MRQKNIHTTMVSTHRHWRQREAKAHAAVSTRTQPESRKANANNKEAMRKKEKQREQGWNDRFGVNDSDSLCRMSQLVAPKSTHSSLSKEHIRRKSSAASKTNGVLLPWNDPNKQIKRKPIVSCAPFMRKNAAPRAAKARAASLGASALAV